jgi:hypothetical protein
MPRLNRLDLEDALSEHEETQEAISDIIADEDLNDSEKTAAIADLLSDEDEEDADGD